MNMAAPMLEYCETFFKLLKKPASTAVRANHSTESILVSSSDAVLVWDNFSSCIRVTSTTKPLIIQTLLCSNPPLFNVTSVIFNANEQHVALVGTKGIAIMELPSRYGSDGLYQAAKEKILCRSLLVDERYFSSHRHEKVLKVLWHPGSPNSSHLCVLTSDNVVRIYNISKPHCPHQTLPLGSSSGSSRYMAALGESFISMAFGKAVSETKDQSHHTTWPLYLLTEMGSVFVIKTQLWLTGQLPVEGPLNMCPSAEDNYGSDACDILHLDSSPEVIVISTTSGSLIHCILLSGDSDKEYYSKSGDDELGILYVYDIVKLELMLTVSTTDIASIEDDFATPLSLYKDPIRTDRYHCVHSAGVHTVQLPWLFDFHQFPEGGRGAGDSMSLVEDEKYATHCQHVLCTQPLADSKPSPMRGLAIIPADINTTSLLCLLSDFTCIKVSLRNSGLTDLYTSLPSVSTLNTDKLTSRRSFDEHIKELLQRTVSNPLIKTGCEQSLSSEQGYQLLTRATQICREQYVNKILLAREELNRRVNSLEMLKEQQFEDLDNLRDQKLSLTDAARNIAERYEDVCEHAEQLLNRMDKAMSRIQSSISDLSEAERSVSSHLATRQKDIEHLQIQLEQIKKKHAFQRESLNKQTSCTPSLTNTQLKRVNGILSDESHQISELVQQLQNMLSTTQ